MTEKMPDKPTKGSWDRLGQNKGISFELNKPVVCIFNTDSPQEVPSTIEEDAVYYKFSVTLLDGTITSIDTSAWTLLNALKKLGPLTGKKAQIVKKLENGKQSFSVVELVG